MWATAGLGRVFDLMPKQNIPTPSTVLGTKCAQNKYLWTMNDWAPYRITPHFSSDLRGSSTNDHQARIPQVEGVKWGEKKQGLLRNKKCKEGSWNRCVIHGRLWNWMACLMCGFNFLQTSSRKMFISLEEIAGWNQRRSFFLGPSGRVTEVVFYFSI